jgi:hypothetical protein
VNLPITVSLLLHVAEAAWLERLPAAGSGELPEPSWMCERINRVDEGDGIDRGDE